MKSPEQEPLEENNLEAKAPHNESESKEEPKDVSIDNGWLDDISKQSWEPELLISGVAIYLSISLPELFRSWYAYYQYNYSVDVFLTEVLGLVLYALLDGGAYILIITFIVHFASRAFWVGLIGLRSVYPQGIIYENLPKTSDYYRTRIKEKLRGMDEYIIRLDRFCSILFSVCFSMIIIFMGVFAVYLVFLGLVTIIQSLMSDEAFEANNYWIFIGFMVIVFSLSGIAAILNLKRYRNHPKYMRWQFQLSWFMAGLFMPFVRRPYLFLTLLFRTNTSKKQMQLVGFTALGIFYVWSFIMPLRPALPRILDARSLYTTGSDLHQLKSAYYDNLRGEQEAIPGMAIQADIISEPYLKLFISYPHHLDADFAGICDEPVLPDSLTKFEKRNLRDAHRLACIKAYYQVYINDSLCQNLDYMYFDPPDVKEKGMSTYISIKHLKPGKYTLKLTQANSDTTDKRDYLYQIPFWYNPDTD